LVLFRVISWIVVSGHVEIHEACEITSNDEPISIGLSEEFSSSVRSLS